MITIEEKVDFFRKIILDKVEKEYNELKKSLDEEFESKRKEIEREAEKKSQSYLEQFVAKAEEERKKRLLEAKKEKKEKILEIKNRLIEKVYQSVLSKCAEFVGTEEYYQVISQLVNQVKDEVQTFGNFKVLLTKNDYRDRKIFKNILIEITKVKENNIKFVESNKNFIGGLVILNNDETAQFDLTLSAIVSRNKLFIGNEVQKLLEENGGLNE